MPLHQLFQPVANLAAPNTGVLQGGAGVQTAGLTFNPGISAPFIEGSQIEVYDVTAPTQLAAAGTSQAGLQVGLPAAIGKVLTMSPTGSAASRWRLQSGSQQRFPRGSVGVVVTPEVAQVNNPANGPTGGFAVSTAFGNEQQYGDKAIVQYDGPCLAFVETNVGGSAISAGMFLTPDGAGNLTYAGASPNAGTVVAIALGAVAASVSIPVLIPVQMSSF